jgi:protein TonB
VPELPEDPKPPDELELLPLEAPALPELDEELEPPELPPPVPLPLPPPLLLLVEPPPGPLLLPVPASSDEPLELPTPLLVPPLLPVSQVWKPNVAYVVPPVSVVAGTPPPPWPLQVPPSPHACPSSEGGQ